MGRVNHQAAGTVTLHGMAWLVTAAADDDRTTVAAPAFNFTLATAPSLVATLSIDPTHASGGPGGHPVRLSYRHPPPPLPGRCIIHPPHTCIYRPSQQILRHCTCTMTDHARIQD